MSMQYYRSLGLENLQQRSKLLKAADRNYRLQAAIREQCKIDPFWWINTFCWTYDPRAENFKALGYGSPAMPFILWDFQRDFVRWLVDHIRNGKDGLLEKSRDMGASWLVLTTMLWFWLFGGSGNDFLIGSRKDEFVDSFDSMDALFPKLRWQLYKQPSWLLPAGFDQHRNDNFKRLANPENGNFIRGESNNPTFGTGGRYKAVLLDEFAKWRTTDRAAWQSLSDATPCKLPVSSAYGKANMFYELRSGLAGEIDVFRLHWKLHPLKDQAWYEKEKRRRTPEDLASEVDIDYSGSISNKAYRFNPDLHTTSEPLYNPEMPLCLTCDFNISPMCWMILHKVKGETLVFKEYAVLSTHTETLISRFCKDFESHRNKEITIYGDASGKFGTTKSLYSDYDIIERILKQNGWWTERRIKAANPPHSERINCVNKYLRDWEHENKPWIKISKDCRVLIDSLEQTRRQDSDGRIDKSDSIEHMSDALGYYICFEFPLTGFSIKFYRI